MHDRLLTANESSQPSYYRHDKCHQEDWVREPRMSRSKFQQRSLVSEAGGTVQVGEDGRILLTLVVCLAGIVP